ncbi:MAG: discoidin domain-containing protein [Rikenellaceae bacterium]|nr:discoidin domain-containing protein [Rikenellaceae bacterium]
MKNILKYAGIFFAAAAVTTACQGFEDYTVTIDAPAKKLAYVNPSETIYSTTIIHTPIGSPYDELDVKIPVQANTTDHERTVANFSVDNSLIEAYNAENGTAYAALPDGYMKYENMSNLVIPDGSVLSTDSLRFYLEGDVSNLTEEGGYMVALSLGTSSGLPVSSVYNVIYILIDTEFTLIRENPSSSDITGTLVSDRSGWSFDGDVTMFDGSTTTYTSAFASDSDNVIDLGAGYSINAFRFYPRYSNFGTSFRPTSYTLHYSTDNSTWNDIGTATTTHILVSSSYQTIVLYGTVTGRYIKITPSGGTNYFGMAEFDIYAE